MEQEGGSLFEKWHQSDTREMIRQYLSTNTTAKHSNLAFEKFSPHFLPGRGKHPRPLNKQRAMTSSI